MASTRPLRERQSPPLTRLAVNGAERAGSYLAHPLSSSSIANTERRQRADAAPSFLTPETLTRAMNGPVQARNNPKPCVSVGFCLLLTGQARELAQAGAASSSTGAFDEGGVLMAMWLYQLTQAEWQYGQILELLFG